jgi:hypothetical protein
VTSFTQQQGLVLFFNTQSLSSVQGRVGNGVTTVGIIVVGTAEGLAEVGTSVEGEMEEGVRVVGVTDGEKEGKPVVG